MARVGRSTTETNNPIWQGWAELWDVDVAINAGTATITSRNEFRVQNLTDDDLDNFQAEYQLQVQRRQPGGDWEGAHSDKVPVGNNPNDFDVEAQDDYTDTDLQRERGWSNVRRVVMDGNENDEYKVLAYIRITPPTTIDDPHDTMLFVEFDDIIEP